MTLLHPEALSILAVIPWLVLRHRHRPRPVRAVPHLHLWRQTAPSRPSGVVLRRLRRDLLLLLQALFIAALVLALSRPVLSGLSGREVVLVFDLSASMAAAERGVSRLDRARAAAFERIASLSDGDRVRVVSARARPSVSNPFPAGSSDLRRAVEALRATGGRADLEAALGAALASTRGASEPRFVLLTDSATAAMPAPGSAEPIGRAPVGRGSLEVVAVAGGVRNLAVSRIAASPTRGSAFDHDLLVEIASFSDRPERTEAVVIVDGNPAWRRSLELAPGELRTLVVEGAARPDQTVAARIAPGGDLALDDTAWLVLPPAPPISVLLAGSPSRPLEAALSVDPGVRLTRAGETELAPGAFDVSVWHDVLPDPADRPGSLVFRPAQGATSRTGAPLRATALGRRHPLLAAADPRPARARGIGRLASAPGARLLLEAGGRPALAAWDGVSGRHVEVAMDLDATNWPELASFPIFVANAVRWLAGRDSAQNPALVAGDILEWRPGAGTPPGPVRIEDPDGSSVTVERVRDRILFAETGVVGVYTVRAPGLEERFAVNVDAGESDLRASGAEGPDIAAALRRERQPSHPPGPELTTWLLLAGFLLAAGEWVEARRRAQPAG